MAAEIFISYRRDDALATAARLDVALSDRFGRDAVFRDVTQIAGGALWPDMLEQRAHSCRVMLVVIGQRWQTISHSSGELAGFPRLADENDWVRREIRMALAARRLVVPLLIDNANMPTEAWLGRCGLKELARRQARPLRTDDFDADLAQIVELIVTEHPALASLTPTLEQPAGSPIVRRVRFGAVPVVPSYFRGREDALAELEAALSGSNTAVIAAVAGMGGVGKTQLAASYFRACEREDRRPVMAWIDARLDIEAQLVALAAELGIESLDPSETVARLVTQLRAGDEDWLIVADNVADPDHLGPLLNVGGNGHLVVTSRYAHWDEYGSTITVDTFPTDQGAALLRQVARRSEDPNAEALTDHLGGLALALTLAGAACRENVTSFEQYLRELKESGLHPLHDSRVASYDRNLAAVWEDSLNAATRRAPDAPKLLAVLARLDWRSISRTWLRDGLADTALGATLQQTLVALAAYQLVTLTDDTIAVIHGIVAAGAVIYRAADEEVGPDELLVALFEATLPEEPSPDRATVAAAAGAIHHLHAFVTADLPCPDRLGEAFSHACAQLAAQCDHTRNVTIATAFAAHARRVQGADHPDTILAREQLGIAYRLAGSTTKAIAILEQVVADFDRIEGADNTKTLIARGNLATAYANAGRTTESTAIEEHLVAVNSRVQGDDHPGTIRARANLAVSYWQAGRFAHAIALEERVVADRERILGIEHPDTIAARHNLALTYHEAGRTADALSIQETVVADRERILGLDHPDTIQSRNNLAISYGDCGRTMDAISIQERLVSDRERLLGSDHPDTILAHHNLAFSYNRVGRFDEALNIQERVVADRERVQGSDHPDTILARHNLASSYDAVGRAEATTLQEQVVLERERVQGISHPDTLLARHNLAVSYCKSGRVGEAISMLRAVRVEREQVLGIDHPDTILARHNLVVAYIAGQQLDAAIATQRHLASDRARTLGSDHPDTIATRHNLALVYHMAGRHTKAITVLEQVIGDSERVQGPNHPNTLLARANLEDTRRVAGELRERHSTKSYGQRSRAKGKKGRRR